MVGSKCNLKMHVRNLKYPFTLQIGGPKSTFLGRLRNLTATLIAYIFGMKHDIDNRSSALTTTRGLLHRSKMPSPKLCSGQKCMIWFFIPLTFVSPSFRIGAICLKSKTKMQSAYDWHLFFQIWYSSVPLPLRKKNPKLSIWIRGTVRHAVLGLAL